MGRLQDKVVVITGAGRGLGRIMAHTLAAEGAKLALLGRTGALLDKTAAECPEGAAFGFPGDLGVVDQCRAAFDGVAAKFGKIDALINNAAIYEFFRIDEATPEQIKKTLDANLLGPMLAVNFATPLLRNNGAGEIINISSDSVVVPYSFLTAYATTKAGLEMFSRGIRLELKNDNIRVTTLRVGGLDDPDRDTMPADMDTLTRFMEANAAHISAMTTGEMLNLKTVSETVVNILTFPTDGSMEHVELRPSSRR